MDKLGEERVTRYLASYVCVIVNEAVKLFETWQLGLFYSSTRNRLTKTIIIDFLGLNKNLGARDLDACKDSLRRYRTLIERTHNKYVVAEYLRVF